MSSPTIRLVFNMQTCCQQVSRRCGASLGKAVAVTTDSRGWVDLCTHSEALPPAGQPWMPGDAAGKALMP
jgi:hypothetical protein